MYTVLCFVELNQTQAQLSSQEKELQKANKVVHCTHTRMQLDGSGYTLTELPSKPFTPKFRKYILTFLKRNIICEVVRIGSIIIFHVSKL